mgnify:CR=1 FL=1
MRTMNKAEQSAAWDLFARVYGTVYDNKRHLIRHYRAFRRQFFYSQLMGCWMLHQWHGMTVGIEKDGYTHT